MKEIGYNITQKEFKKLEKLSENIYNTSVVIDYFLDYSGRSVFHSVSKNLTIFIHSIRLSLLRAGFASLTRRPTENPLLPLISRRLKN